MKTSAEKVNFFFIKGSVPGALPVGSRVVKVVEEPGDAHPVGACAKVLSSLGPVDGEFAYFVEWETHPGVPVFVRGRKIGAP